MTERKGICIVYADDALEIIVEGGEQARKEGAAIRKLGMKASYKWFDSWADCDAFMDRRYGR